MAVIGTVTVAAITAGPAYLGIVAKRMRREQHDEGELTRSVVDLAHARMDARLEAFRCEVRDDMREVREEMRNNRDELRDDIRETRDWQTSHTAEHLLIDNHRRQPPE
ncbi:hypothetical protein [Streptomyces sp. SM12]|uniref:hypothetical protein n=1 Tax=Streptomyces sp. SM12 TaxID=1071602 RepID=UPI000CD50DEA|nr:hypothetical protein [Streptomyces sp. SM12]